MKYGVGGCYCHHPCPTATWCSKEDCSLGEGILREEGFTVTILSPS